MNVIPNIKTLSVVATILAISLLLAGCSKDPSLAEVGIQLKFINTSPDAAPVQFKLNDVNAHSPALSFNDTTAYRSFEGGTYSLTVAAGSTNSINTNIDFRPQTSYSLFAVDSAKRLKVTVIKDDVTTPTAPLRAKVRFFNLSPNAGSLALRTVVNTDTVTLSSGRSFNDIAESANATLFQLVPSNFYDLLLYSGTTLVAKLAAQPVLTYKIYTIYARGFVGGTGDQALSLGIIANN
jgi:hypothetical protein